jgi:hypothetical protein
MRGRRNTGSFCTISFGSEEIARLKLRATAEETAEICWERKAKSQPSSLGVGKKRMIYCTDVYAAAVLQPRIKYPSSTSAQA